MSYQKINYKIDCMLHELFKAQHREVTRLIEREFAWGEPVMSCEEAMNKWKIDRIKLPIEIEKTLKNINNLSCLVYG